jgi:hypothetical protein
VNNAFIKKRIEVFGRRADCYVSNSIDEFEIELTRRGIMSYLNKGYEVRLGIEPDEGCTGWIPVFESLDRTNRLYADLSDEEIPVVFHKRMSK